MTLTTSPRRMLAPSASQWASNAPVGMGIPGVRPRASAHFAERWPAILSEVCSGRRVCRATPVEERVDGGEELFRREASPARVPHPLVAHGADAAGDLVGVGDAAEGGGDHVAVFEGGDEFGAVVGVVAQPVEELGPSPLGAVDAAAPVDSLEVGGVGGAGDFGGLTGGAVVAPEVVFAEGDEAFADGDDAGAGGIERDGFDLVAVDAADFDCLTHGAREGGHLVVVGLGFELGVGGRGVQRVLCDGGAQLAAKFVEDGDAHAERAEVDPCHYAHGGFSLVRREKLPQENSSCI